MPKTNKKNVVYLITQAFGSEAVERLLCLRKDIKPFIFCFSDQEMAHCVRLESGKEFETVTKTMSGIKVDAVVNRGDSLEALYGLLVDYFKVPGPSYKSILSVKNKANLQRLIEKNNLVAYRPKTKIVALNDAEEELLSSKLPVVVKPFVGAKSRGVIKISRKAEIKEAIEVLRLHFKKERSLLNRSLKNKLVLIEEFINGQQFSCTCYVDAGGNLRAINFVDIITARDLGYKHMQLIFRNTPSQLDEVILQQAKHILQRVIRLTKIKSTCLHPEFFVINRQVLLIEINVRIGGFRTELLKFSTGMDLEKIALTLALDEQIKEDLLFAKNATACEVWREESGVVKKIEIPKSKAIVYQQKVFKNGEEYFSPPAGNRPLAKFYVTAETHSLELAKKILNKIKVTWQN